MQILKKRQCNTMNKILLLLIAVLLPVYGTWIQRDSAYVDSGFKAKRIHGVCDTAKGSYRSHKADSSLWADSAKKADSSRASYISDTAKGSYHANKADSANTFTADSGNFGGLKSRLLYTPRIIARHNSPYDTVEIFDASNHRIARFESVVNGNVINWYDYGHLNVSGVLQVDEWTTTDSIYANKGKFDILHGKADLSYLADSAKHAHKSDSANTFTADSSNSRTTRTSVLHVLDSLITSRIKILEDTIITETTPSFILGWSSYTATIKCQKSGRLVSVSYYITGTSNLAGVVFSLPKYLHSSVAVGMTTCSNRGWDTSEGGTPYFKGPGLIVFGTGGVDSLVAIYSDCSDQSTWANSGTKAVQGSFVYPLGN